MDGIIFLIIAFLVAFSSIKLSYYGDALSKQTKLGSAFIGGMLIASITSLPEFVTSISSVLLNNPSLSFGDILGSNMFNIFVLSIYNIWFFKQDLFKNTNSKYKIECLILIIEYLIILIATYINTLDIVTIILLFLYLIYTIKVINNNDNVENNTYKEKHVFLKFFAYSILLIVLSILLTTEADKITRIYPKVSSSSVGAILLGITTSLPEVVSTYALIKYKNYNMAISNMLGSNIFNFLVLALSDIFVKNNHIYNYVDKFSYMYIFGGIFITVLLLISIINKKMNKASYTFISILMSLSYFLIWYFQFH